MYLNLGFRERFPTVLLNLLKQVALPIHINHHSYVGFPTSNFLGIDFLV